MKGRVWLLPVVIISTLAYELSGVAALAYPGHGALVWYLASEWPRMATIPRGVLLAAVAVLGVFVLLSDQPAAGLFVGFNRAAWFATFMAALSYLREAAETSRLVRQCGRVIMHQPPSRRYATLTAGSLMIGMLLNMAVLNLLGVMAKRANTLAAAGGSEAVRDARTRRLFTAITRGFSTAPLGSPLTMTMAVILSVLPDLQWWRTWPIGVGITVLLMALGTLMDRLSVPRHLAALVPAIKPARVTGHPIASFLLLVLAVFMTAVLLEQLLDSSLTLAILIVAPCASWLWITAQFRRYGWRQAGTLATARLMRRAPGQFSNLRAETAVLSGGALMGTLIAALLPVTAFAAFLSQWGLQGVSVALLVLTLMVLLPQLGLNPILVATIVLASMADPEAFGLSAELLAVTVACGWALSVSCAPVASTILITGQIVKVPPQVMGWRWNGLYVALGFVLCCLCLLVLSWLGL